MDGFGPWNRVGDWQIFSNNDFIPFGFIYHKLADEKFARRLPDKERDLLALEAAIVSKKALEKIDLSGKDVDWIVPHQANLRIIKATAQKMDVPMDRVVVTVQDHGNTSAASIPLSLDESVRQGRVEKGQRLGMVAFGAGLTWGSVFLRY